MQHPGHPWQPHETDIPLATASLMALTFLSFALEGFVPGYRYHFWLYGRQALGEGQWWQFATSLLLHANLLQLGFNMCALYIFGPPLERSIGSYPFSVIYLASGVVGNLLSVYMTPDLQTVGASGCLFGVAGAWIGLQIRHRLFPPNVVSMLVAYIVLMLAFGFVTDGALNNWAHLGGLACGLTLSLTMQPKHLS